MAQVIARFPATSLVYRVNIIKCDLKLAEETEEFMGSSEKLTIDFWPAEQSPSENAGPRLLAIKTAL